MIALPSLLCEVISLVGAGMWLGAVILIEVQVSEFLSYGLILLGHRPPYIGPLEPGYFSFGN